MTFGDRIRSHRIKNNMSQQDLANLLNVTPQTISKWENDLSEPSFQMITEMTKVFQVSHDELFIGKTEIIYRDVMYTALKDIRMGKYYRSFIVFTAFLSLTLIITSSYLFSLELPIVYSYFFSLFSISFLLYLFMNIRWSNDFEQTSGELIEIYHEKIVTLKDDHTLYLDNIEKIQIKVYNIFSGLRIYDDTGYIKIYTKDNQKIIIRDIKEVNDLKLVFNKTKNK